MKRIFYSLFGCDSGGLVRAFNDCSEDELNRIVHVAFVRKGATINETPSGLIASILALETSCDAFVIREVNGTMAEATYQTGKGAGKQINRVLSGTHSIAFTDFDIVRNIPFWNNMISQAQQFDMWFFTSAYAWKVNKALSVSPKIPITDDISTFIESNIAVEWSSKTLPTVINVTATKVDLLEACPVLFDNTEGFTNGSGSMAGITSDGFTISADSGDSINVGLSSGATVIDSAEVTDGELPTNVNLLVASTGLAVVISGSSVVSGTYNATIRASNACGVAAEFVVKIIIT